MATQESLFVIAGLATGVVCLLAVLPRPLFGEDPQPLLRALQRDPAVLLSPPGLGSGGSHAGADSGVAVVARSYETNDPMFVLSYFGAVLPEHGWHHDQSGALQGGERWQKQVSGKVASYDVIPHQDRNSVEVSVYIQYDTGILG